MDVAIAGRPLQLTGELRNRLQLKERAEEMERDNEAQIRMAMAGGGTGGAQADLVALVLGLVRSSRWRLRSSRARRADDELIDLGRAECTVAADKEMIVRTIRGDEPAIVSLIARLIRGVVCDVPCDEASWPMQSDAMDLHHVDLRQPTTLLEFAAWLDRRPAVQQLTLPHEELSLDGCAILRRALEEDMLPQLRELHLAGDGKDEGKRAALPPASDVAVSWQVAPTTRTRRASSDAAISTLALLGYDPEQARAAVALAKPTTPVLAEPLRLAEGLALLTLRDTEGRKAGGMGSSHLAVVGEAGATPVLGGGPVQITYDTISQAVLSWSPPRAERDASVLHDAAVLRGAAQRVRELRGAREEARRGREEAVRTCADVLPELSRALDTVTVADVRGLKTLVSGEDQAGGAALQALDAVAEWLATPGSVEGLLRDALSRDGCVAPLRYAVGQWLMARVDGEGGDGAEGAQWVEAEVVGSGDEHALVWTRDGEQARSLLALHPWNHAPRELPLADFEEARQRYSQTLRGQHASIVDALSGRRLDVLEQLVPIPVTAATSAEQPLGGRRDGGGLDTALHGARASLESLGRGSASVAVVCCFLLTAGPAGGKSSMMSQLVVKALARGGGMVPILIRVQQLQKRLLEEEDAFAGSWNWVDAFLRLKHGESSALYRMLRQAMMARRALLLIDGIDEGGKARERIERHLAEVLAPQGHVLLATSRPAGIDETRYAGFHDSALGPLGRARQQALEQRLGAQRAAALLPYLREHMPVEGGERITTTP